jgi:hypothetical protein
MAVRLIAPGGLGVDAYLDLASTSTEAHPPVSQGNFRAEPVLALTVGFGLLAFSRRLTFTPASAVSVSELAVILISRCEDHGRIGPSPDLYTRFGVRRSCGQPGSEAIAAVSCAAGPTGHRPGRAGIAARPTK